MYVFMFCKDVHIITIVPLKFSLFISFSFNFQSFSFGNFLFYICFDNFRTRRKMTIVLMLITMVTVVDLLTILASQI